MTLAATMKARIAQVAGETAFHVLDDATHTHVVNGVAWPAGGLKVNARRQNIW
jgi:hypothetical protein